MIGQRIQQLRLRRGLTLSELADRAGVAKSYISAIERSIQDNPSIQVLEKIAAVLHVPVQIIIQGNPDTEDAVQGLDDVIDLEWVELAKEAMKSGISKEQFKEFLEFQKWRLHQDD